MKKLLLLLFLLIPSLVFADGLKVSQMSQKSIVGEYDLLYLVDMDEGAALSKSITFHNLKNSISALVESDPIWTAAKSNYSTKAQADLLYLGVNQKAYDSDLLDGHDTSYFQIAGSYITSLTTSTPTNLTGFIKGNGSVLSADNSTYLTSVTAHNLLSATHGDTTAAACARGSIIVGDSNTKWVNLAFPATPTGKVLIASATDIGWSASALGTAAYTASTAYDSAGAAAAVTPTTLGLVIGTNVQAYNSNLTAINQALTSTSSPSFTTVTASLTGTASGNLVSGGALGTPSSGTLTSCTALPISGLTASTSTALGVGSIELGHASDTTIARVNSGIISVEGITIPSISSTNTLTNKRHTPRIYSTTSIAGTPGVLTPEIDTYDYFELTAQAAALNIANKSTSTPTGGEKMIIAITSDATPRALTYGTDYVAKGGISLPTTTVASKTTTLGFIWNAGLGKWNLVAVAQE